MARFAMIGWDRISLNSNSADGDQGAYLQLGLDIREHGIFTDGKRPPLYPLLLATFAQRNWTYFTWAKIINLIIGLMTIWTVFEIGRRLFNPATGILAALLLSINMEFVLHSTFALAESLLVWLVLLAWFCMVRALQYPKQTRYWLIAGILAGLTYLTKGTGPILAAAFIITATWLYTPRLWLRQPFWMFVAGLGLISATLWGYNWFNFGTPFFNSAINNVMWMDSAAEKYVADSAQLPTLTSYLQNNSLVEVWQRWWMGLLGMRYFFLKLMWPTRDQALDRFFQAGYFDLLVAGLALAIIARWRWWRPIWHRHREKLLLTVTLVVLFYLLFAWYLPIAPFPIRFILVLAPILYLLIAAGVVGLVKRMYSPAFLPRWGRAVLALISFAIVIVPVGWFVVTSWLLIQALPRNPFTADAEFNTHLGQPIDWVKLGHEQSATPVSVMWGPSHQLPVWRYSNTLNLIRTPAAEVTTGPQLQKFMAAGQIAYVIVDDEMLDRLGDVGAEVGLTQGKDGYVQIGQVSPDWALGFVAPGLPCQMCVFRRLSADPPITPADYVFNEGIRLSGYELDDTQFRAGGQVVVTLYWQSLRPTPTDYTIFTQLLGPDFQLHGQMDRPPLDGYWPTSRWLAEQKFIDKFIIPINVNAPPGDYKLLVGLYDLNTGQRAPARFNQQRLPDDAVVLDHLTLSHE